MKNILYKEIGMFFLSIICGVCAIFMGLAIWRQDLYEPYYTIRIIELIIFVSAGLMLSIISYIKLVKTAIVYWGKKKEVNI